MGAPNWLAELTTFERDGDTFVAPPRGDRDGRLFGGLIAAQALTAAGATVDPAKVPHSLHAYFLRSGRPGEPVDFRVQRCSDGRAFAARRVSALQRDAVILELTASFHAPEPGADWYLPRPPSLALDDAVPTTPRLAVADWFEFRVRPEDGSPFAVPPLWIRLRDAVADDPVLRCAALTVMSDFGPVLKARPPGLRSAPAGTLATTLDHSLWFHRPFDPAQWIRYELTRVNHNDSRGLVTGALYDAGGSLLASAAQETLWRLQPHPAPPAPERGRPG